MSISIMTFDQWQDNDDHYGAFIFITNGDCDYDNWLDSQYDQYVNDCNSKGE
jgi:hypothetical protein